MKKDIQQTYKSNDTEEWLDRVFTRPIGYLWALLFEKMGIHPNVVTILSIIIGITSAFFFVHGSYRTEGTFGLGCNIVGVLLMMWANFYDSADGQLARMTGKKTQLGRILDGAASIIIFIPVYCAIVWRCMQHHALEFHALGISETEQHVAIYGCCLFVTALFSGIVCHGGQCRLADYYRQVHLYFLNGAQGSELSTSDLQQQRYLKMGWKGHRIEKAFLKTYVSYTHKQEHATPNFQQLMSVLREKYGDANNIPDDFRRDFRQQSLPLMPLTNILTFNTRAIALYTCCLIDLPWLYFVFEIVIMSILCEYMRVRHEHLSQQLTLSLQDR